MPDFQTQASRYFQNTFLPIIKEILLGDEDAHGAYLHSLAWYWEEERASRRLYDVLRNPQSAFDSIVVDAYKENNLDLRSFLQERLAG